MAEISGIYAREILDARGIPAIEAEVELDTGIIGRASVPSGGNTRPDGDPARYAGRGALSAVGNIEKIIRPELAGMDAFDQIGIDRTLIDADGTPDRSDPGANVLCAVSLACAHAAAAELKLPLYRYLGGVNAKVLPGPQFTAADGPSGRFMIRPIGADCFAEALKMSYSVLGAFAKTAETALPPHDEIPGLLVSAIEKAGLVPGRDMTIALACAAGDFFKEGMYDFRSAGDPRGECRSPEQQAAYLADLVEKFSINTLEDPMAPGDRDGWRLLARAVGDKCRLTGDKLFSSDLKRLKKDFSSGTANAVLIRPVQAGTVTETLDLAGTARRNGLAVIIGRSPGETEDCSVADLSVAVNADGFEAGPLAGSENICKCNQFLRIEEQLGLLAGFGSL